MAPTMAGELLHWSQLTSSDNRGQLLSVTIVSVYTIARGDMRQGGTRLVLTQSARYTYGYQPTLSKSLCQ
jgi:hypothetical protein